MMWSIYGRSHSVLSATEQLLGPSVSPESSLSVPADLPANEGPSPEGGATARLQVPREGHAFYLSSSSPPFPYFFHPTGGMGIFLILLGAKGHLLEFNL